jgi:ABC-type polysaccharide/polyol phosphate transport system ATPase subunit
MKKNPGIAIQLTNVSKKYEIHHEKPTLVEKFVKGPNETFWALKNITLTIKRGEKIGLIGPNGSGKTTLLKIIAGITTPTSGSVATYGKVVSLIDLEAGFHPDLTGYQNIYINGMILGMKKREIEKNISSIIDFADIRQFIDAPLFTYSSGMALRLGFAVAIHANPDILLLDEGFGVGDARFQRKSRKILLQFARSGKTIIVVSHWLDQIKNYTNRLVWFERGKIKQDDTTKVVSKYFYHT